MTKKTNNTIKLQRDSLQAALRFTQKVVSSNPQLPILSSILFSLKDKTLTLSSTDLYFGIQSSVTTTSNQDAVFAVPGSIFKDMVNSFESEVVEIEVNDSKILVKADGSTATIPTQSPRDYPDFPQINKEKIFLPVDVLREIDDFVCFAAGTDQARPILTTLLIKMGKKKLEAVATDGFRLATLEFKQFKADSESEILVPAKYLSEVRNIAEQADVEGITIFAEDELKQLRFEVGQSNIYVRLIEGDFPPYEKIIPANPTITASLDGESLKKELKRASILAREVSNIVELEIGGEVGEDRKGNNLENLIIRANSANQGRYEGVCPLLRKVDKSLPIAFNSNYLLDFLTHCKPESLDICVSDSLKPAMIKMSQKKNYQYVVMPFRVSSA